MFEVPSQDRVLHRLFRNPLSGWNSVTPMAGFTSGTDAPMRLSGRHRLASEWSGSVQGMRLVGSGSGTGSPVPPVTLSLLFLLSEVLHRQPRAVYKFWAQCCAFSSSPRNWESLIRCSLWFDSGYILRQSTAACGRCNSWTRCACTSLCNNRCRIVRTFLLWRRGSSHGPALLAQGAVLGQGCCFARCWSTTGAAVPQLQFLRSLTHLSLRSG